MWDCDWCFYYYLDLDCVGGVFVVVDGVYVMLCCDEVGF